MPKLRLRRWSNILWIWSSVLLYTSPSRRIASIENWRSSSTTIRRGRNLRSCLCEKVKACTSLAQRKSPSKLRRITSKSEWVVAIFPLMSSLISILRLNSRNWKERIQLRDSARRSLSRKQLWIMVLERRRQSDNLLQEPPLLTESPLEEDNKSDDANATF